MPLTQSTAPAPPASAPPRARRLRRLVAGALLATGAGAGTVAIARAGDGDGAAARGAERQLRVSLHLEERRELTACETAACAAATPRQARVHRVRTFSFVWAAPGGAAAAPACEPTSRAGGAPAACEASPPAR